MANLKRVNSTILLPTGLIATFDIDGQQIAELQGAYSIDLHKRIVLEALDNCTFDGYNILPRGFIANVKDFTDYFKNKNLSWEQINNL